MNLNVDTCKIVDIHNAARILNRTERQVMNYVKSHKLPLLLKKGPFYKRLYLFNLNDILHLKQNLGEEI